ncbi:complex I 51 kDa subunit family protein [Sulfobacillus harzensis]|uniref:Electron transport complex protein RnfC n=1 Tax=Sulfobacillus harzensis TaxID=2729629 RepID=A0A7Y0L4Q6_9FIRM|nr:NADH-ubiquinone oxidoreductase-F iron-sulfur binding region domain-containing protein [Sulfobacillus harzensis]NMP23294.1 electron transport complex protein RnfC [Sulfobacillus harzensis]
MGEHRLLPDPATRTAPTSEERLVERGFERALSRAQGMTPEQIRRDVTEAGIMGRGGAAFPTGRKWDSVASAPGEPKYVVMNADESEPGTFKDRVLLAEDPFGALVGLAIAARAVGASHAYVYIRGEYQDVEAVVKEAAKVLERRGVFGPHLTFEVRRGAGAYIAGEETALFNSIEGRRPEPRVKPPFPTVHGLFGKPTLIQNVETLANVAVLLAHNVAWFREQGTDKTPGTKLVCLSGHVERPGVYEVPFGVSLKDVLYSPELGGGIAGGRQLKAVLLGGAAGTFVTAQEAVEATYDYAPLRAMGASIGSGAIMVFDETVSLVDVLRQLAHFFADESCGQCVPCRIGTRRLLEMLDDETALSDGQRLRDLGRAMQDASICGLGQTAPVALLSLMDRTSLWESERSAG